VLIKFWLNAINMASLPRDTFREDTDTSQTKTFVVPRTMMMRYF